MNIQEQEERDFHVCSIAEMDRYEVQLYGAEHPDHAWILSNRDVWYPNPFYEGPPVPHPEYEFE